MQCPLPFLLCDWYYLIGSHAAFLRVYEGPILLSRQPGATPEEREMGRARAEEVIALMTYIRMYLVFLFLGGNFFFLAEETDFSILLAENSRCHQQILATKRFDIVHTACTRLMTC